MQACIHASFNPHTHEECIELLLSTRQCRYRGGYSMVPTLSKLILEQQMYLQEESDVSRQVL